MKRYLHKPKKQDTERPKWPKLYKVALARAEASSDPRIQDLLHYAGDPEKACRHLSIISMVDIEREFPQ